MSTHLELDHLVVSATTLAEGVAHVEQALGVAMSPGGKHDNWGTHNALLGLGPYYLEVIAIDPDAPAPDQPRWFDLDNFSGPPRLTNWVARTNDIAVASGLAPLGMSTIARLSRGDLSWSMVSADQGKLPFDGAFPGLIQWDGDAHPAKRLPDAGCRLASYGIGHPQAEEVQAALARYQGELSEALEPADEKSFHAIIDTAHGPRRLG